MSAEFVAGVPNCCCCNSIYFDNATGPFARYDLPAGADDTQWAFGLKKLFANWAPGGIPGSMSNTHGDIDHKNKHWYWSYSRGSPDPRGSIQRTEFTYDKTDPVYDSRELIVSIPTYGIHVIAVDWRNERLFLKVVNQSGGPNIQSVAKVNYDGTGFTLLHTFATQHFNIQSLHYSPALDVVYLTYNKTGPLSADQGFGKLGYISAVAGGAPTDLVSMGHQNFLEDIEVNNTHQRLYWALRTAVGTSPFEGDKLMTGDLLAGNQITIATSTPSFNTSAGLYRSQFSHKRNELIFTSNPRSGGGSRYFMYKCDPFGNNIVEILRTDNAHLNWRLEVDAIRLGCGQETTGSDTIA